jgi:hypothetical protein
MAGWTGLEPATSGLTGQRSNRAELPPHELTDSLRLLVGGTGIEPVTSAL